jgi:hypothetical protein
MGRRINRRRKPKPGPLNIAARKAGLVLTVTRRDALVRELDTAIWLWFFEKDPLSIHLIVGAAYTCLCDLGKDDGKAPVAKTWVGATRFTTAYDWLRHAASDPNDVIDFPYRTNELMLWDALISFEKIFGGRSAYMMTFQAYFCLHLVPEKPKFREGADAFLPDELSVEEATSLGRLDFFVKLTEMFAAQIAFHSGSPPE